VLNELQRRNYSPEATRGYIHAIKQFAEYFGISPEQLGGDEIRQFELHLLKEKKLAPGTVEGRMSALRFLYRKELKRRDIAYDDLIFPKVPRKLPVVLNPEEITRMIEAAPNLMHRTILMVLYATGIRRAEASLLKVSDVVSKRMVIHILQGKGSRKHRLRVAGVDTAQRGVEEPRVPATAGTTPDRRLPGASRGAEVGWEGSATRRCI